MLSKIKTHIINESTRLSDKLTSYNKNFTSIKKRLNNYKNSIYDQLYSNITYVVDDFHEKILKKFYENYIERGLNDYKNNISNIDFGVAQFLNMSINLNEIIRKESNLLMSEYRNQTLNQIEFLYKKNIQNLDELFLFSQIKSKINNEIDNLYNSILLPVLKNKTREEELSSYDLPQDKIEDINNLIDKQLSETKKLMKKMEGKQINDQRPADFSQTKDSVYNIIIKDFSTFISDKTKTEKEEFVEITKEKTLGNFKLLLNNFICSFGVDFFNRILRFNGIQKLKLLYQKLKYSLAQTNIYYIGLVTVYEDFRLPEDIKLKLFTLNRIDSTVDSYNNLIFSNLIDELNSFIDETKIDFVNKYINDIISYPELNLKFNENLKGMIKGIITSNKEASLDEYKNIFYKYIQNPFLENYKKILNVETEHMKYFIDLTKIELKIKLKNVFSLNSDTILANIQNKLNETTEAIEKYKSHNNTFKISNEVYQFFEKFGQNYITPKYQNIKDLLDNSAIETIIKLLDELSDEFRSEYSINKFQNEVININKNLSLYFNKLEKILKEYGYIESVYMKNLNEEKSKYSRRLRGLDLTDNDENKFIDVKLDSTFSSLKNSSLFIKNLVKSLNLFLYFEDMIEEYINRKEQEYINAQKVLMNTKNKNRKYELMVERLEELKNLSSEYYMSANSIYKEMKENIILEVNKINELLNSCEIVTFKAINNEYIKIKDEFNKLDLQKDSEIEEIPISLSEFNKTDNLFTLKTEIENYLIKNKFTLDLIFNEENKIPKVLGKVINNVKPKKFNLDFYYKIGALKHGDEIEITFNNISSYTNIIFEAGLNNATLMTNFNFEKYNVNIKPYYQKENSNQIIGSGIQIPTRNKTRKIYNRTAEKNDLKPLKNITLIENYVY